MDIDKFIIDMLNGLVYEERITSQNKDSSLNDLLLDPLDCYDIILLVDENFNVELDEDFIKLSISVNELISKVQELVQCKKHP